MNKRGSSLLLQLHNATDADIGVVLLVVEILLVLVRDVVVGR